MTATVDLTRWSRLSIFDQMGNIGSEVGRALNAKQNGRTDDCQYAVVRALDLFAITVTSLIAKHSGRAKEVLRARNEFLNAIYGESEPENTAAIDRYFTEFAIAARRGH